LTKVGVVRGLELVLDDDDLTGALVPTQQIEAESSDAVLRDFEG